MNTLFRKYLFLLFVVASLLAPVVACSFENRSDAYLCPTGNECEPGRVCTDGWCVLPNTSEIDADLLPPADARSDGAPDAAPTPDATPLPDAALACPAVCNGGCTNGICLVDCPGVSSCLDQVVCPAGLACRVTCDGSASCAGGVDCRDATSCQITCSGTSACAEAVVCGAGICSIECSGAGSCPAGLDCELSCQCDTVCPLGCGPNTCPGAAACTKLGLCDSTPGSCKTCP